MKTVHERCPDHVDMDADGNCVAPASCMGVLHAWLAAMLSGGRGHGEPARRLHAAADGRNKGWEDLGGVQIEVNEVGVNQLKTHHVPRMTPACTARLGSR